MSSNVKQFNAKRKLDVLDRIMLLSILPQQGSFTNLKLVRKVREDLSFSESENKRLQFRNEMVGEQLFTRWNTIVLKGASTGEIMRAPDAQLAAMFEKDPDQFKKEDACPPKAVFLGEIVEGLIKKALKELDAKEAITADHFKLYEMFVGLGDKKE